MYELVGANTTYFPYGYGTLLHFKPNTYYGAMLVIDVEKGMAIRAYSLRNGSWYTDWQKYVRISDLGYTDVTIDVPAGGSDVPNISGMNYIPVILRVSNRIEGTLVQGNYYHDSWTVFSEVAQNITIRFYKYPI